MPSAILALTLIPESKVDKDAGVVRGCQLAKGGKLATFEGLDGKTRSILMTPKVVAGLLALFSASGQATAHWTHNWIESGRDGLESKVATFKGFRVENGDLLADAYLWPTAHKEAILHAAEFDRGGMMISTVFDYTGPDSDATPTNVQAADFVETGAATTALCAKLSETQTKTAIMDEQEFLSKLSAALKDPTIHAAIKAMVKEAEPAKDEPAADATPDTTPAILKEFREEITASLAALKKERNSILAEAEIKGASAATALLGKGGFVKASVSEPESKLKEAEGFITAQMSAGCPNQATAIARMAKDKPELYAKFRS